MQVDRTAEVVQLLLGLRLIVCMMTVVPKSRSLRKANGKMRACSLGLVGLGFRVRDKVRVSVRDRVSVRVSDGV